MHLCIHAVHDSNGSGYTLRAAQCTEISGSQNSTREFSTSVSNIDFTLRVESTCRAHASAELGKNSVVPCVIHCQYSSLDIQKAPLTSNFRTTICVDQDDSDCTLPAGGNCCLR